MEQKQRGCPSRQPLLLPFYLFLFLSVYQPTSPVSEQHIDLLKIENRGYFTLAKMRVHHRLPFLIFTCPVIRRSGLVRLSYRNRGLDAAAEGACSRANFTFS